MWGKGRENLCLICIKMGAFWVWFGLLCFCFARFATLWVLDCLMGEISSALGFGFFASLRGKLSEEEFI